jgi:hypothetical protein
MRFRSASAIALAAGLASHAFALTPQAPARVTDAEAQRLLRETYGEAATLQGEWPAKSGARSGDEIAPTSRTVCADSGADTLGPRRIAVCTSFADAGHAQSGEVDLFLMLDPRGGERQARIGAYERGVQTGSWGSPGDVTFQEIGPGRVAFALASGYSTMGWSTGHVSLYYTENGHSESDKFENLLSIATDLSNGGACDPDEDRGCRARAIDLTCTLRFDRSRIEAGRYAVSIAVSGTRGARKVARTIPVPFDAGRYRIDAATLQRDGCDEGF